MIYTNSSRTLKGLICWLCVSKVQHWLDLFEILNTGKGVASSPTPQCSSYWKGSLLVALDYGRQLLLFYMTLPCRLGLKYADCIYCSGIRPPPPKKEFPRYDTELHLQKSLLFWRVWSPSSLSLFQSPLWPVLIVPVKVLCMKLMNTSENY